MMRNVFVITGPTASGKSGVVQQIYEEYPFVKVVNADSKQVYRELPIITAQPENRRDYSLYSCCSVADEYSVMHWVESVRQLCSNIEDRTPLLIVGGSCMYIHTLIKGISNIPVVSDMSKKTASDMVDECDRKSLFQNMCAQYSGFCKVDYLNTYTFKKNISAYLEYGQTYIELISKSPRNVVLENANLVLYALLPDRSDLYQAINQRTEAIIQDEAISEVQNIQHLQLSRSAHGCIGLKEITNYLNDRCSFSHMVNEIQQNTRNYAKRQMTWIRNNLNDNIFTKCSSLVERLHRDIGKYDFFRIPE
ncbi:MAG: IPP transferase family protein [Candidatus Xenolissoclinum pacificiensis L6]|uniref:tRNA dimethylallyltransferase n=1 Tax=Candidatus Xenolissoclinum pacificiensis L6 TaxID=1401685 RepID=W2UY57_9RICK|nr:MAG: IPP transferase family protein [Candidatus Xenolissoclinum pacificiensis L6]